MLTAVHDPDPKSEKLTEYVMDYVRKPFTAEGPFRNGGRVYCIRAVGISDFGFQIAKFGVKTEMRTIGDYGIVDI